MISQKSKIKRISTGLLALWMSGIFFLTCCGKMSVQAAEIEKCPLAKKGHCQKSLNNEAAPRFELAGTESGAFNCCGFLPQLFSLISKVKKSENNWNIVDVPSKPAVVFPVFHFIKLKPDTFFKYHSLVLNRRNTFLRNCVFRI